MLLADGPLKLAFGLSGNVQINYVIPTRADHAKRQSAERMDLLLCRHPAVRGRSLG
jgi:hypothetical protein